MGKVFGLPPPLLSNVVVDVDKNWGGRRIENLGAPVADNDACTPTRARALVSETYPKLATIYCEDYGLHWADLGVIAADYIYSMCYLGNGIVILGEWANIWRSTDYGLTWADLGAISTGYNRCMAHLGNGIVVCGSDDGHIYRSTDYGLNWADLGLISALSMYCVAYLGNGIAIMGDSDGHVFRSTDDGATWADLGEITGPRAIWSMSYLSNGIAILGADGGRIYRSIDYGASWTDLGALTTNPIYSMAYLGNGICLAGGLYTMLRSTNYGETWTELGDISSSSINTIAYLGNGIVVFGDHNHHVFRSIDYGETWTDLGVITTDSIYAMAYLDNGIIILGDEDHHVYRSTSAFQLGNFNPQQLDKVFQFGCLGAITANGTSYLAPGNGATQLNEIRVRVPRPGILRNLYGWQRVASGAAGRTDIYTVRVNGANTAITCTLNNATEGADIVNEVVVAAGDQVSISLISNNVADTSADVSAVIELM